MTKGVEVYTTNKWWKGETKTEVTKSFSLRLVFAFYRLIRTAIEFTVLISIILGILLILFSAWMYHTSDVSEKKLEKPLLEVDAFLDDCVDGLNWLTQTLPEKTAKFVNNSIDEVFDGANSLMANIVKYFENSLNKIISGLQSTSNKLATYIHDNLGGPSSYLNIPSVSFTAPKLDRNWIPTIEDLDLTAIRIPPKGFSVYKEVYPFVKKMFEIPRTTAYYALVIGIIFLVYVSIRLLLALFDPFLPRLQVEVCGCNCMKCIRATKKSGGAFFSTLARPWIHVPITIGICLILLVVLFLNPQITALDTDIRIPLREADRATADFIDMVNNYIDELPKEAIDYLNEELAKLNDPAKNRIYYTTYSIIDFANTDIITPLNDYLTSFFAAFSLSPTYIPSFGSELTALDLPESIFPEIPDIPVDELLLPTDLVSIAKPLNPWIDDQIKNMRTISWNILQAGIWLIVIPGAVIVWAMSKPFVPHKMNEFFNNPRWLDERDKKDVEMGETPPDVKHQP